jgi:hypothetical protein
MAAAALVAAAIAGKFVFFGRTSSSARAMAAKGRDSRSLCAYGARGA